MMDLWISGAKRFSLDSSGEEEVMPLLYSSSAQIECEGLINLDMGIENFKSD